MDGLETQLNSAALQIAVLEREVKETQRSRVLTTPLAHKEVMLEKQGQVLMSVLREVFDREQT
jgi:hypothetical protein